MLLTILGLLFALISASCLFFYNPQRVPSDIVSSVDIDIVCPPGNDLNDESYWLDFGAGPGIDVVGFPSIGGRYLLQDVSAVELDFLGLDRFTPTQRPPKSDPDWQAKEEAHCDRLRRLGAEWWESLAHAYMEAFTGQSWDDENFTGVGWPATGGVWVLRTTLREAVEIGTARIRNAYNMEERCQSIEKLGGVFYQDPKDCPHLNLP
ncbi:uncharacterized protein ACLA_066460 [Aspergillus clavatus NRRL 1]|uniref:Uncharacterized protein n=1 Tax=Aspergillus clavatus (strain ATCC 1007 / CBS 513.65 / DSM 816 / NCTC 3887 / NRRL 1 / QM 1276 / 107) TaxID=344612 RepID=A1CGD0_ASPCL|nr:uncharacterized protein ACLA_066460 [Aspergillus clavatus NRRL 1]EAW11010.1 conserved hypothetical protein [Aspergillus clavatus NRRL 1]